MAQKEEDIGKMMTFLGRVEEELANYIRHSTLLPV